MVYWFCNHSNITCQEGLVIPRWTSHDTEWEVELVGRALTYFIALSYLFLGVSIVTDRFMGAIEVITSKTMEVEVRTPAGQKYITHVKVWNETVANLTLALGSSAPEILLSVIEICGNDFKVGSLGPATIVGSAAFNQFIIIAVCIYSIPSESVRRIKKTNVYMVTVFWSIFAYFWLYLMVSVISEDEIEVWEGILTLVFFPLTVLTAYLMDIEFCQKFYQRRRTRRVRISPATKQMPTNTVVLTDKTDSVAVNSPQDKEYERAKTFEHQRLEYIELFKSMRADNPNADVAAIEQLVSNEAAKRLPKSRTMYRNQNIKRLINNSQIAIEVSEVSMEENTRRTSTVGENEVNIFFDPCHYVCYEDIGTQSVTVRCERAFAAEGTIMVDYETYDGTAIAVEDYVATSGTLIFEADTFEQQIDVEIVDNDIYEEDEYFYIRLFNAQLCCSEESLRAGRNLIVPSVVLKTPYICTIMILDNDHSGQFELSECEIEVTERIGSVEVKVVRKTGLRGEVIIPYSTFPGSAKPHHDYISSKGDLHFGDNEETKTINIPVINGNCYEKNIFFFLEIYGPIWTQDLEVQAGEPDGRPILGDCVKCKIKITESTEFKNFIDKVTKNSKMMNVGTSTESWKQQFANAFAIEENENENYGICSLVLKRLWFLVILPWNLLYALIPPPDFYNGWPCFVGSIGMIGLLTPLIVDLANHFGCTLGIKNEVTAITVVALGSSIPDTFASRIAALQESYADGSILNVTGSNSLNVFLGIGIAWLIGAAVHAHRGTPGGFRINAGPVAYSVTLFSFEAVIALTLMYVRRRILGGELGGRQPLKFVSAMIMILLWVIYILLASLESYCLVKGF